MTTIPNCPICRAAMVERTSKTGYRFYGCTNYGRTKCKGMRPIKFEKEVIEKKPRKIINGSDQQISIWHAIKAMEKHVMIFAGAGTGKTTTIVESLYNLSSDLRVIFCAFNVDIVKELSSRLPDSIETRTMNGFGNSIVQGSMKVRFNEDKLYNILDTLIHEDDRNNMVYASIIQLVNLCKYNMIDGTDYIDLDGFVLKHGIELNNSSELIYTLVPQVIKLSKSTKYGIDYVDQLWFIYAYNLPIMPYDVFFGDEVQDWNKLQQYVAIKAIGNTGKLVCVGDEDQSIYGFAGADTQSMQNLYTYLSNTPQTVNKLPLSITYRCPAKHVKHINNVLPHINLESGSKIDGILETIPENTAYTMLTAGDMVICRRNAPIVNLAYTLIRQGMPVIIKGRDIGTNIINFILKLKAHDISELLDKAETYRSKEIEKLSSKKRSENAIQIVNDKVNTLIALCDGMNSIDQLIKQIQALFTNVTPQNAVILMTIHKAKGLESERVFIWQYDRIELPLADEEFRIQERNAHYIALSRSKNELYLVVTVSS